MRSLIIPGLLSSLLLAAPAVASTAGTAPAATTASDVKVVYVNPPGGASTSTRLLVVGAGAGLGFLVSNYLLATAMIPLANTIMGSWGLSQATTSTVASSVTAIGLVWGAYAGSLYAYDLIIK